MGAIWLVSSFPVGTGGVPVWDKGLHFAEYGGLGLLTGHAALRTWADRPVIRVLLLAVLITVAWGVLDELHQAFVPRRSADWQDLVADFLGAVAGVTLSYVVLRCRGSSPHGG